MTEDIFPVTVPKWGIEMQEGTVTGWHVSEGDEIRLGEELVDIETDKIVNTLEAPGSGVLRRQLVDKGTTLGVGALLGVIAPADAAEEAIDAFIDGFVPTDISYGDESDAAPEPDSRPGSGQRTGQEAQAAAPPPQKKVRVSPAAAQRARELGVDIAKVTASGRRVSPEDVERYAQGQPDPDSGVEKTALYEAVPLTATRRTIARRLTEAKQQIPHFYLSVDVVMEGALARREELTAQGGLKISVNDLVLRASVLALQAVPGVNVHLVGDEIRRFGHVNLAVAVATDRGLLTPVIQQAEALDLSGLAAAAAALGERARSASLTQADVENGTFTVSNLGMHGIGGFQAIINPPQCAILAVGACGDRAVADAEGVRRASVMTATLSCDHRAVDGALGANFLSKFREFLEDPAGL